METQNDDLTPERLTQAKQWLDNQSNVMPDDVRFCLKMLLENMLKGEKSAKNAAKGFHELLVKFGFKPSSEKNKPSPLSKDAPSQESLKQLAQEAKTKLDAFCSVKESLSESMKKEIFIESAERDGEQIQVLSNLQKIVDEHERDTAQDADLEARIASGGAADPALAPADETLFPAGPVHATASAVHFSLNKNDLEKDFGRAARGLQKETIQTKRYDFSLQMHCFDVSYETARDPISGRSMSAAPETIGLKGFQVSLRALVNLVLLTVAFLVPMHRVSRMLGNARIFHRSNLARYLGVVAQKALPVYLHMARELSNAKFLWADATPTRVNDVTAAIEKRKIWDKGDRAEPCEKYPWETLSPEEPNQVQVAENKDSANEDQPQEDQPQEDQPQEDQNAEEVAKPLWRQLQDEFGYAFSEKRKKDPRPKTRHQTMVIHGRADPLDATSHTVLFRSCLGDVGNVLDKILQNRSIKNKELYLQCDHSSANLPSDPDVLKRISFTVAGCLAHARRPFKRHFSQDPERCHGFLSMMFQVTHFESLLKKQGKNRTNTFSVRRSWSAHFLEMLQFGMQLAIQDPNWSDQTPLGKAARHFIKHFKKLTVYLNHPELEATNNMSERLLRPEKLSQGSSYFRDSLEGRARFDILRSIHQTCVSAGIPLATYLLHILLTPDLDLQQNPEKFTPRAVKKLLAEKPTLKSKLERILTQGY